MWEGISWIQLKLFYLFYVYIYVYTYVDVLFANSPGDQGSIPDQVILQ